MRLVFDQAYRRLTRKQVLGEWSPDYPAPHPATLARWLDCAVARGLLKRGGQGRKSDPFHYWLPERDDKCTRVWDW